MIYSKLYKKYYPLKSGTDVLSLNQEERSLLFHFIKHYPGRLSNKMLSARKHSIDVEGWDRPKGWRSAVLPSHGLADVLVDLQQKCDELISKIQEEQPLTGGDLENINRILYANKYCRLLSWFLFPTLDGQVSAVMKQLK